MRKSLALVPFMGLLSFSAFAQPSEDASTPHAYVIAQTGDLRYVQRDIAGDMFVNFRDRAAMHSLIGGYSLNQYFAVEAGYSQTRTLSDLLEFTGQEEPVAMQFDADVISVRALGKLPLPQAAPGGAFFAGLGYNRFNTSGGHPDLVIRDKNHSSWIIGAELNEWRLKFRVAYEEYDISGADMRQVSFSLGYRF